MVAETAKALRAEIDHLRRLAQLVTDANVRAELRKMIEELENRLRELGARWRACPSCPPPTAWEFAPENAPRAPRYQRP